MRIIGHHGVQNRLKRLVASPEYPQAFLFVGPESVGKRLVALQFAWTLVGQDDAFESRSEADLAHPDIALLVPEQVTEKGKTRERNIPVEAIRENIGFLSRYPLTGKRRVLIINDAHRLSHGAQNALLKTLEEPNETSVLILVTHDATALFDTIHSRLQRINFSVVPEEEMLELGILSRENQFLLAFGRPGIVSMALQDSAWFSERKAFLERLSQLGQLSLPERLRLAEDLASEGTLILPLLEWLVPTLRVGARGTSVSHIQVTYGFLEELLKTQRILRGTQANMRLQLEKLFLKA